MAGGYDGSIRIDTRINETGFNKGVSKVGTALKGMMSKIGAGLAAFSLVALGVVAAVASIASALITAGIIAFKFLEKVTMNMYRALSPASAYYDKVSVLKTAFDALNGSVQAMFSSLLTAATPILMKIIDWLIKVINLVSMIIAALSGQKTYMKYISGAAQQSARSTGQAAKNTDKMTKAAKGALAAWDELNVLQMEQANQDTGGGGTSGGNIMFEETPIEEGVTSFLDRVREALAAALLWIAGAMMTVRGWLKAALIWFIEGWVFVWGKVGEALVIAWDWIKQAFLDAAAWISTNIVGPMSAWFIQAWEWIKQAASDAWDFIINVVFARVLGFIKGFVAWYTGIWQAVHDFIVRIFTAFVDWYTGIWQGIHDWFVAFADWYNGLWQGIRDWIIKVFTDAWDGIKAVWEAVSTWFTDNVITPLETAWQTLIDWLKETWDTIWNGEGGIKSLAKGAINGIITFINAMIRALATGINTIISGLNKIKITIPNLPIFGDLAGKEWGFNLKAISAPQIPLLAKGAVIPPNAEFAAILGDQKSGRNIEAPEALIRQIVREEVDAAGGDQNLTIPLFLDGEKVYEGQLKISRRRGRSLAFGGAS